jgi:ribosomal protein S18 acetylase RimI-like enzyme
MERMGGGTSLIKAVRTVAISNKCRRIWLITTNDNLPALHFYQRRGFTMAALHHNAIDLSRNLKLEIPLTGIDGIPIRDEIEIEFILD